MPASLSPSARRVQEALHALGHDVAIQELPRSTRTAAEAAQAVGCHLGQIAKSLVFRGSRSGTPVLVITSGSNRVDEQKLADLLAEAVERPDADFVRQTTGFAIGGVPPVGHATPLTIFIDRDLLAHETIWAAGGTPNALFSLPASALVPLTGGTVAEVA